MPRTANCRWRSTAAAPRAGQPDWVFGAFVASELAGVVGLARGAAGEEPAQGGGIRHVCRHRIMPGVASAPSCCGTRSTRRESQSGLEQLVLTVTETNVGARTLYEKFGFRSFGIEPRAIRVGDAYCDKNHMIFFLAPRMTISRFSFPDHHSFRPRRPRARRGSPQGGGHQATSHRHRPRDRAACRCSRTSSRRCPALHVGVFSEIWGNPVRSQVREGVAAYKAHGADAVIGLGGGAALDVAKAIALMATHPGDILEYAWDHPQVRPIGRAAAAFHRAADHRRHRIGSGPLGGGLRRRDARQEDHLLAAAPREVRVRRSRAHARPAAGDHRGHGHGRAHAQHRVVPFARIPSAVRRHRARRRAHRGAGAADRRTATAATCRRAATC